MRHCALKFRINVVALYLDDTTAVDCRLETVGIEVLKVDIVHGLPVRKKEFHSRCCYTFYSLEVTHVGIGFILHKLVEEHTVNILCTKSMHNLREIFYVDGPTLINHILGNTRQIPNLDEAVEAVQQGRFAETIRQRIEVAVVDGLFVMVQRNITHKYQAALRGYFFIIDGGLSGFQICLQCSLNLSWFLEYYSLDFVESCIVVVAENT